MSEKPGYKSTEFWLSLVAVLVGAVFASGVVAEDSIWAQALGVLSSVLGALGYSVSRSLVKKAASEADAKKVVADKLGK